MDSTNPYTFVNLLSSQQDSHIPQPSIDLGSSEVPVFSSQCTNEATLGVEERKERRKWSPIEDVVLISAWLNTSKDPVVSNEQKAGAFWKRIQAYFNASPQLADLPNREVSHCKQRWGRLNNSVCKFVGCYEAAMKEKSSGQNDDDVIKASHAIYFNDYQVSFVLEHAWRELRHDQKWCSASSAVDGGRSRKRKTEDAAAHSPSSQTGSNGDSVQMGRPPGVKAAKGKAKRGNDQGSALLELQSMWDIKRQDLEMKNQLSKQKLLNSLVAKSEPLSDIEMALKNKLINEMLS